jgi:hypothetical protein
MKKIFSFFIAIVLAISTEAKPHANPIDTVDVICYDLQLNTDFIGLFGMSYIFANNSDYKLTGAIFADSIPPGNYTNCVMDLTNIATNEKIPATAVDINLGRDAEGFAVITGHMLGEDNVLYNLNLSWQTPSAKDTVVIDFDDCASVAYYPDLGHDFMLSNEDDKYDISIDIVQVPMGNSFTESNLNIGYSRIANKDTKDTIKIATAEGRVWQSNDTTYLSAMVTGFDSIMYDIHLWYAVPKVVKTVELDIPNATFYNELASDGYYALVGTTTDKTYEFAISLLGNTEEDIPGTYVNDGLFGGFSGVGYDFLHFIGGQYTTYIAKWNADKKDYDIISIEKGETVIEMDEEQNVSLGGRFVGEDGIEYKVTLMSKVDKPHIIDDAIEGAIERIFVNEDELTVEQLTDDKVRIEIMTDHDLLAMWFYVEQIDNNIIIPEGEYSIDTSDDYWSVIAADGSLGKSFYATHDGEYFTSFYFMTSGTVTVSKKSGKLAFEVNALNSYDVPIHIIYEASTTALEESSRTQINSQKKIIDGQLMIIRNGKTYNALGTQVE